MKGNYIYGVILYSRTLVAIVLTSMTIGRLTTYAPETGKARLAAARIFEIINREPAIDSHSDIGIKPVGGLKMYTIIFSYKHCGLLLRMPIVALIRYSGIGASC